MASSANETEVGLLDISQVAELLGCSERHVYRLCDSGRMPRPFPLGGLRRWTRRTIQRWIDDDCPPVKEIAQGVGR